MGRASPFGRFSVSSEPGPGVPAGPGAPRGWRLPRALGVATAAAMVVSLVGAATVAAADPTLYVSTSGSDAAACAQADPCLTIGHAVMVAAPGSTIVVEPGTYHEQVFITKRLTLTGHDATIDASGLLDGLPPFNGLGIIGMGVEIAGPGSAGTVFQGFTVENAPAEGILAGLTSHIAILDNVVTGNDKAATMSFDPMPFECAAQGNVPGDCGEGVHLLSVSYSRAVGNDVHDNVGGFLLTDEAGPNHGNLVANNRSIDNKLDCGITLPSHNAMAVSDPSKGGVYDNTIIHNVSEGNGGAGVGMFAPFPGAASYDNHVIGNVLEHNGEAGVGIHSHAPGQNVSGNVIVGNWISGNGIDPDFVDMTTTIGIMLGSALDPTTVTVASNHIADQDVGIYRSGPITANGLPSNKFASTVATPIH
jgi:nitrous oxidase accessory protein NosD